MPRRCRLYVLLLACLLAALVLLSALFVALESDHDCAGEDCPVCALIALCRTLLRDLLPGLALLAAAVLTALPAPRPVPALLSGRRTLVTLRVKLSD